MIVFNHLVKLLCHFADDFRILHMSDHLSAHSTCMRKRTISTKVLPQIELEPQKVLLHWGRYLYIQSTE